MKIIFFLFAITCLTGCATPARHSSAPYKRLDKSTEYSIVDTPNGFTTSVVYSQYQFVPRMSVITAEGKSALISIAYAEADVRGRKIEPINEQRIRISTGRNLVTGVTTWSGSVPAFYTR